MPEIAEWLEASYGDSYDIVSWRMPRWLLSLGSYMSDDMKYLIGKLDKDTIYDNSGTIKILNIQFRDTKTAILEMVEAMISTKYIPDYRTS